EGRGIARTTQRGRAALNASPHGFGDARCEKQTFETGQLDCRLHRELLTAVDDHEGSACKLVLAKMLRELDGILVATNSCEQNIVWGCGRDGDLEPVNRRHQDHTRTECLLCLAHDVLRRIENDDLHEERPPLAVSVNGSRFAQPGGLIMANVPTPVNSEDLCRNGYVASSGMVMMACDRFSNSRSTSGRRRRSARRRSPSCALCRCRRSATRRSRITSTSVSEANRSRRYWYRSG